MNPNEKPPAERLYRLDAIPLELPESNILARLGYRRGLTELPPEKHRKLQRDFAAAFALCRPRGRWRQLTITLAAEETIHCGNVVFPGRSLVRNFGRCRALWVGAATLGERISAQIRSQSEAGRVADALVADAVGSETADAAMDFMQKNAGLELRKHGRRLTRKRFSPGYGDFPLETQKTFFELLALAELGLTLNERCYFHPEKTVTAIAGII